MTMARRLPGNSVQLGITRDPTTTSHYMPEDPQCCVRKWYFSREEIDDHSPSRRDNIELSSESHLRKLYCSFLKDLGKTLKVPQVTIATAIMFCHRFYMRQSHARNDWQIIATVSMFLACKVEESPCALRDVVIVAYELMYRLDPSAPRRIRQSERYNKQKELISIGERLLLATMAFDFNIEHPYKPLVAALKRLKISHNDLAKVAWNFVNDWLCTTLCLQYKPHYIAAGSLFLAAKFNKVKLPTEKGNVWWLEFDISPKQLEEVIQEMLRLLEQNKEQTSRCGKVSESIAGGGKAISHSAQSGITSASAAAPHSSYGATVESGVLTKSAVMSKCSQSMACGKAISHSTQSGITCVSAAAPHSSYGTTVESGVLDKSVALSKCSQSMACGKAISQTAQSGISSGSVAAPHSSYEATVESRVLGKSVVSSKCSQSMACGKAISQSAQSGISNGSVAAQHSSYGTMVESGVLDKSVASSKCSESMACGKAMPHSTQSGISSGSVAAQHASHETTVESDVVGKSAASSKCTQNLACRNDGHVSENGILQSQASDCGSANSVVEDGDGDIRPKTVESAQNMGFGIVSVHGGRSQIDVNRIREKMKKRQLDKAASMKLVNAMDDNTDNTAWIERELENGIKVESTTPADKKRRRVL